MSLQETRLGFFARFEPTFCSLWTAAQWVHLFQWLTGSPKDAALIQLTSLTSFS